MHTVLGKDKHVELPVCAAVRTAERHSEIRADRAAGMSVEAISRKHHLSSRRIRAILAQ